MNIEDENNLREVMQRYCPKIIINCIGLVKQIDSSTDPIKAIQINSLLPHRLTSICESVDAKLIHISTDCVFNGKKGMYNESDDPNATDLYGRTKLLGEIIDSRVIDGLVNETFDLSEYNAGMYFVKSSNETSESTQRVIIK